MPPDRWEQVADLYHAAREREPGARAAFLDAACNGDDALRREVESLLKQDVSGDGLLESVHHDADFTMIGQALGHYMIEAKLGEGGMGVVYKARDLRLGRPVAIKVLHVEAVLSGQRRRRFVQEAKAASALNHPNIIHVYDIDNEGGLDYIAMEYVEGHTLEQWIGRQELPVAEALKYAVQMADALAAAHDSGIVHRDIKPDNIMVDERGLVRILDFGVAKLTQPDEGEQSATQRTEEGALVGTVAYMSPEQAQGKTVDGRSDIFSFGSVLYKMVTGRQAFEGESKLSVLDAIRHREPTPAGELRAVPRDLQRIIERCLRKDPARRFQTMADLKVSLEDVEHNPPVAPVPVPSKRPPLQVAAAGLCAGLVLALAAGWRPWHLPKPQATPPLVLTRLTADSGFTTDPVLFAPGKLLAYASDRGGEGNLDIWIQQLGSGSPVRLTQDKADKRWPTFSPDGTRIAFRTERDGGGIEVVPALGGEPRWIAESGRRPRYSPDGSWILYWVGSQRRNPTGPTDAKVFAAPASGGAPRQIAPEFANARYPIWSPDGKYVMFAGWPDTKKQPSESYDWWVAPFDGGPVVKTGASSALRRAGLSSIATTVPGAWLGKEVVFSAQLGDSRSLWQMEIPPQTRQVSAAPVRLTATSGIDAEPTIASDGSVVYTGMTENSHIWNLPLDAYKGKLLGAAQPLTRGAAADVNPWISADGTKLVFLSARAGNSDVWLKDLARGVETAVTVTAGDEGEPRIARDGAKVAYSLNGIVFVASIGADGRAGVPTRVCQGCGVPAGWEPDGRALLLHVRRQPTLSIGWLDPASGQHREILKDPDFLVAQPDVSPDGRWISFNMQSKAERNNIYVAPYHGSAAIDRRDWIAITAGESTDNVARWSPDGNRLYFFSNRDGAVCIWTQQLDPATKRPIGRAQDLYHFHNARLTILPFPAFGFSLARDKLVFPLREITGNIWMAKLDPAVNRY